MSPTVIDRATRSPRGRSARWKPRLLGTAALLAALLSGLCGCQPPDLWKQDQRLPVEPAASYQQVVRRVNENSVLMNFTLDARGDARAQYLGRTGKPEPFDGTVKMLFRRPRDLYMKIEHSLGGDVMQIGSNSVEFWVWKKLNDDRYWWGRHDQMDEEAAAELPIHPEDVVEIVGLSRLPEETHPDTGPLFTVHADTYLLTFLAADAEGHIHPVRNVRIDRREPYLIREMEYLSPAGRILTRARVTDYQLIPGTAVRVPHLIRIDWPARDEFLQMKLVQMQRYEDDPTRAFTSPRQQRRDVGEAIRVDRQPATVPAVQLEGNNHR